ncbi:hypothetical protein [Natronococcus pandeyae]|uniref:hypothetical protein n=1 Tax=Natronococcus pandeyae TaxID=2055836 RepID=UPI00165314C4|nr:hypothetical protein [Natronococcus pandeyae]
MASRLPVECPLCRETMPPDQGLEDHLVSVHEKRKLARLVVEETTALEEDIS